MYLIEWENIPRMTEDILDHARCRQIHAGQGRRVGYLFFFDYFYGQVTGVGRQKQSRWLTTVRFQ